MFHQFSIFVRILFEKEHVGEFSIYEIRVFPWHDNQIEPFLATVPSSPDGLISFIFPRWASVGLDGHQVQRHPGKRNGKGIYHKDPHTSIVIILRAPCKPTVNGQCVSNGQMIILYWAFNIYKSCQLIMRPYLTLHAFQAIKQTPCCTEYTLSLIYSETDGSLISSCFLSLWAFTQQTAMMGALENLSK